jgi:hypothetical protein
LYADLHNWSTEWMAWSESLDAASRALGQREVDPDAIRDTLRLIEVRTAELQARAEAVVGLEPAIDFEVRQLIARTEALQARHTATLVVARVYRLEEATRTGNGASEAADALASDLLERGGARVEFDPVWDVLLRWGQVQRDDVRLTSWASACASRCAAAVSRERANLLAEEARSRLAKTTLDPLGSAMPSAGPALVAPAREGSPVPPRWRVRFGPSWTVPLGEGAFEGGEVRLGPSGGMEVAVARTGIQAFGLGLYHDRWRVRDHPGDLRWARSRVAVGWCPELAFAQGATVDLSVRPWLGVGAAIGGAREAGIRGTYGGFGAEARLELVIQVDRTSWIPWIGLAPYGRAGGSSMSRLRFTWNERPLVGLAASWNLGAPAKAQILQNEASRSRP